jgi:putative endonuclease
MTEVNTGSTYWLYMLSNQTYQGPLYLGDTSELTQRMVEHLNGERRDFAHYHKLERLVYFESWTDPQKFAARLRRVRNWPRDMRILLIESLNPGWDDLSGKIFESMGVDQQQALKRRA